MKKRIIEYRTRMDVILENGERDDWEQVMEEHLQQVAFFQHERLIHLLVTLAFALFELLALGVFILSSNPGFAALACVLLVLLVPYVRHYYLLENEVQYMYKQYDRLQEKKRRQEKAAAVCPL